MAQVQVGNRKAQVEIWTQRYRIIGKVHVPSGGYKGRLSDLLNKQDNFFLSLTEVTLSSLDGQDVLWQGEFLVVNKVSIVLVKAIDD